MHSLRRRLLVPAFAAALAIGLIPASGSASGWGPHSANQTAARSHSASHAQLLEFLLEPVVDSARFAGKRIAILASDGASAFELEITRDYFIDRGARVHILAPRPVQRAPMVGLAAFVAPTDLLTTFDYAGGRRLIAVTWYLDQVSARDYDAVYVPNNLEDIGPVRTNGQFMRFLLAARSAHRPVFVTGNAGAAIPGLETEPAADAVPVVPTQHWQLYAGQGAFDMPQLIGALAATLGGMPSQRIN